MSTERSDEQDLAAFGQAARQLREQRGMTPSDLSGVSRRSDGRRMSARRIGRIEAGEGNPTYDEMLTLATGLGVKASAFFAGQP
jgi:transcriptional regulator with XRE-family HTH domain